MIAEHLAHFGVPEARFGVADGIFAAEQAARQADQGECTVIERGGDRQFLAGLPVTVPEMAELTDLLRRLGILTLGDLAGLPERDVVNRFGAEGAAAHRLARGGDRRLMSFAAPPRDFERTQSFEPTLTRIEEAAFTVRTTAEEFIAAFAKAQLVGDRQRRHFSQPGG